MAGLYIHIPFCKQACHYCNFHFSVNIRTKDAMLAAIQQELTLQKAYLADLPITSIYFGGGTPSLLDTTEIATLLQHIQKVFPCQAVAELTLEANPDDITLDRLRDWKSLGINRLSIGIQSFQEPLLAYLNRAHSAHKALESIEMVQKAGFDNFNMDLLYAIPGQTETMLQADLDKALQYKPKHIAAYCLTVEPDTALGRWVEQGKVPLVVDEVATQHFLCVAHTLTAHDYEQYEVSNFSLSNYYSQHNTNYWKRGSYLGVGPGAHSYNGTSRQYNVSNNHHYIQQLQAGNLPYTLEILQPQDHLNEYIMTSLRTQWGCHLTWLQQHGYTLSEHHQAYFQQLVANQLAYIADNTLVLTTKGKLVADKIASDLFVDK